jgi:NAD(P)-dependent dehydrogenase (short-subunit alcohol dehydrogenase family)
VTLFGLPSSSIMVNVARGNMESGMLEGQTAVVIGGTSGIGLAAAIELCRAGTQVWLIGRTPDNATAAASRIGDRASGHAVDARDAMKLQAFFTRVGEFDHLIVALGGGSAIGAFKELDEVKMRAGFDNKFWPYLNAVRVGVGHIRGSGSITLITGAAGRRAIKGTSGLAAVNGALQAIIGPLALEFAPIRVNAVSPGLIATPYWDRMPEDARRAMYERSAASVPVGRVGAPSDVGHAILFLVGNGFTTGAILDCDGGARLV